MPVFGWVLVLLALLLGLDSNCNSQPRLMEKFRTKLKLFTTNDVTVNATLLFVQSKFTVCVVWSVVRVLVIHFDATEWKQAVKLNLAANQLLVAAAYYGLYEGTGTNITRVKMFRYQDDCCLWLGSKLCGRVVIIYIFMTVTKNKVFIVIII